MAEGVKEVIADILGKGTDPIHMLKVRKFYGLQCFPDLHAHITVHVLLES